MCFTVRQVYTIRCATAEVTTSDVLIYLTTHVDKAVSPPPGQHTRFEGLSPTISRELKLEHLLMTRTPAGIILLFGLLAVVFRRFDTGSYRTLNDAARLIFVSHNAFFLVFLLTAIPYTFAMVSVLFAPSAPRNLLEKPVYRCISFSLAFQVVMYALEVRNIVQAEWCKWWSTCMRMDMASLPHHANILYSAYFSLQNPSHRKPQDILCISKLLQYITGMTSF